MAKKLRKKGIPVREDGRCGWLQVDKSRESCRHPLRGGMAFPRACDKCPYPWVTLEEAEKERAKWRPQPKDLRGTEARQGHDQTGISSLPCWKDFAWGVISEENAQAFGLPEPPTDKTLTEYIRSSAFGNEPGNGLALARLLAKLHGGRFEVTAFESLISEIRHPKQR